jgi:hypothetical protein
MVAILHSSRFVLTGIPYVTKNAFACLAFGVNMALLSAIDGAWHDAALIPKPPLDAVTALALCVVLACVGTENEEQ